jgi:hypothetical protein
VAVNLAGMALRFPPAALGLPCVDIMLSGMAVRLMGIVRKPCGNDFKVSRYGGKSCGENFSHQ